MARTTRKMLLAALQRFCTAYGYRIATSYNDVGALTLNEGFGGWWTVEKIVTDSGAVSHPFGSTGMKAGAMFDALDFASRAHRDSTQPPKLNPVDRNASKETLLDTPEDVQWFLDTHIPKRFHSWTPGEVKAILMFGNEDSPARAHLYAVRAPTVDSYYYLARWNDKGKFKDLSGVTPAKHRKNPGGMERQVFQNDGWVIETDDGDVASPDFNAPDVDQIRECIGTRQKVHIGDVYGRVTAVTYLPKATWWGRLSVPGYLDATPYVYGDSKKEVVQLLDQMYPEDENE